MTSDRLYGNWLRPQRLSVRGVGLPAALFAIAAYLTGLVVLQYDVRIGTAILAGCVLLTAASRSGSAGRRSPAGSAARPAVSTPNASAPPATGPMDRQLATTRADS